jgi:hypothetical protein
MCGACGDRTAADWGRPWFADLAARTAAVTALLRLVTRPGVRAAARSGGWLVTGPTGATTVCGGLSALVAAVRPFGPAVPEFDPGASGRLAVPEQDGREGLRLRVDPGAPRTVLRPGLTAMVVPDDDAALRVLAALSTPPWSLRYYLREVTGVGAPWGSPGALFTGTAVDVVVWLEWARQAGAFDDEAVAARCPLDDSRELDVEIRAGHVVRARWEPVASPTI